MTDSRSQYLSTRTSRGNNILALTLVNIDIGDADQTGKFHQECLSDQETDLEEEIKNSIAGAAGKGWPQVWEL